MFLLVISLAPPAQAVQPYMEEFHGEGAILCGVAASGLRGDLCNNIRNFRIANQQPLEDDSADSWIRVPFDAGLTALVVRFTADGPLDENLRYRIWWENPPGVMPDVTGTSGSQFIIDIPDAPWVDEPRTAGLIFELANDDPQVGVDVELDVYLGLFYNGEPVPHDYVPGADHVH